MQESNTENVEVIVRIRNSVTKKDAKNDANIVVSSNNLTITSPSESDTNTKYTFDHIFTGESKQEEVFKVARKMVEWACLGYNATILAYGTTNSGKTYTMFGDVKTNPGIIPRSCSYLFEVINQNEDVIEASMKCSFVEIYLEKLRDLLDSKYVTGCVNNLKIRCDNSKGTYIQNLFEKYVYSPDDILSLLKEGSERRTKSATQMNNVSSRSHAIFSIYLTQKLKNGTEVKSKLHLVDLAGSENVGKSEVQGIGLAEAQNINKSLSALGNVIYALTEKNREHIPYRDSKLTFLLQDSLGGNSKTILIATINPNISYFSETVNTLKFAKRAKDIKNIPIVNVKASVSVLENEIDLLNRKIHDLEEKCKDSTIIIEAVEKSDNKEISLLQTRCDRLERKIEIVEEQLLNEKNRVSRMKEIFEQQRSLSRNTAKELMIEKREIAVLNDLNEQYKNLIREISSITTCEKTKKILLNFHINRKNIPLEDLEFDFEVASDISSIIPK
jgi:kinesin family protein 5